MNVRDPCRSRPALYVTFAREVGTQGDLRVRPAITTRAHTQMRPYSTFPTNLRTWPSVSLRDLMAKWERTKWLRGCKVIPSASLCPF